MDDLNLGACPRCGAPFAADDLAPICAQCALADATSLESEAPSVSQFHLERPRRKLPGIWKLVAFLAIFSMFSTLRNRRPIAAPKRSILLDGGKELYRRGKLPEAIREFRRVIRIKPREPDAHYMLAVALDGLENFDESIPEYRAAIELEPHHADAHHNLGVILADRDELEEAIDHFREAIRNKAGVGQFHKDLGNALEDQGRLREAIAEYRNAVWSVPENPSAHFDLGNALESQGNLDAAIAELRKAREKARPDTELGRQIERALKAALAREHPQNGERQGATRNDENPKE